MYATMTIQKVQAKLICITEFHKSVKTWRARVRRRRRRGGGVWEEEEADEEEEAVEEEEMKMRGGEEEEEEAAVLHFYSEFRFNTGRFLRMRRPFI